MAKYRLTFGAGMWCGGYWNRSTVSGLAGLHRDAATYQARTTASSDQRVVPRLGSMSRRICQFGADSRPARPRATASRPTVALTWSIRALRRLPRWSGSTRGAWATRHGRQEGACLAPWKASLASVRVTADPPRRAWGTSPRPCSPWGAWAGAHQQVRTENRARATKDPLPEDPLAAPPWRGTMRSGR